MNIYVGNLSYEARMVRFGGFDPSGGHFSEMIKDKYNGQSGVWFCRMPAQFRLKRPLRASTQGTPGQTISVNEAVHAPIREERGRADGL